MGAGRHFAALRHSSAILGLVPSESPQLQILVAGASGVLGRSTLPHLHRHELVGLTRTESKRRLLEDLGAEAVVCDAHDREGLIRVVRRARPNVVVNFLTDLAAGSGEANTRIRREGAANLLAAAEAAGAVRLVVESVAFPLEGEAGRAVEELERATRAFRGEALIVRFGRFWGPGTFHRDRPEPPAVQIDRAGVEAARLMTTADPGTYVVTDERTARER
jgi:nucleoside-diphosphate-sugar epimerase